MCSNLGSGLGHNLEIFAENNRVKGVEGLPDAAAEASRRGVQTIPADIAKAIPLPASSFDVVLCLDILEHLVEPGRCLSEVHTVSFAPRGCWLSTCQITSVSQADLTSCLVPASTPRDSSPVIRIGKIRT